MTLRRGGLRLGVVLVAVAVGVLAFSASAFAEEAKFSYTGEQQEFVVPAGVSSIHVVATGAAGGEVSAAAGEGQEGSSPGGRGAMVSGHLTVKPGPLFIEVGGEGEAGHRGVAAGGFNGGGNAAYSSGGGGGASDVRTISSSEPASTLASRLLVAAGGGGGGEGLKCSGASQCGVGGAGGAAEEAGATGTVEGEGVSGGGGGGAGTATEGGLGGAGSVECVSWEISGGFGSARCVKDGTGPPGEAGALGSGGIGNHDGGGGGGGLWGGGSGGGVTGASLGWVGAGGGGGGSNLLPAGGEAKTAAAGAEPSVIVTYTAPPTCSMVEGTGTYLKRHEKGRFIVREHLSTTLTGSQMLSVNTESGETRFGLTKLSSAKCEALVGGGFKFSGEGPARYYSKTGDTVSFSFTVKGGKAYFSAKLRDGSVVVVNEEENALSKSNEVIH